MTNQYIKPINKHDKLQTIQIYKTLKSCNNYTFMLNYEFINENGTAFHEDKFASLIKK